MTTLCRMVARAVAPLLAGAALAVGTMQVAIAQDTTAAVRPPADTALAPDTTAARHLSPLGALWRSFLIPGWGQAKLNRKLTGGIFVAWEGVTAGMMAKTGRELNYLHRTNSGRAKEKRQEHEDWLALLVFNHLFSGLEAYVSAHLSDFPEDLHWRVGPVPGGAGASMSIPFRLP